MITKVSKQEFLDFIMAQPPDREYDYDESTDVGTTCGCPMVQYGKEKLNIYNFQCTAHIWDGVGMDTISMDSFMISDIIPTVLRGRFSYGQLQTAYRILEDIINGHH